ncbi:hypothetical protein FRC11_003120, partial [Ceratobasidium sp. 423]
RKRKVDADILELCATTEGSVPEGLSDRKRKKILQVALHQRFVVTNAAGTSNPIVLSERSYIYNEQAKVQFGEESTIKGLTLLDLAEACETGRLALPGLGVKFDYRPGDITLIRGRLIKHGVVKWEGDGNHICTTSFNHYTEWGAGGVQLVR